VEYVTGEPDSNAEEEEDVHQEAGPSTMTREKTNTEVTTQDRQKSQ
jgi:hypothetical protein